MPLTLFLLVFFLSVLRDLPRCFTINLHCLDGRAPMIAPQVCQSLFGIQLLMAGPVFSDVMQPYLPTQWDSELSWRGVPHLMNCAKLHDHHERQACWCE